MASTAFERCPGDIFFFFCSKSSNYGTIFSGVRFMIKTTVKIARHEPNDMATLSATFLIGIQRLSHIVSFTTLMFSSVFNVLGRPLSRPSLSRLYHNCACILLILYSQYTILNTVFLIHFFEGHTKIGQKQIYNPKWLTLSTYVTLAI